MICSNAELELLDVMSHYSFHYFCYFDEAKCQESPWVKTKHSANPHIKRYSPVYFFFFFIKNIFFKKLSNLYEPLEKIYEAQ